MTNKPLGVLSKWNKQTALNEVFGILKILVFIA